MLVLFNLEWKDFDIDHKVERASKSLATLINAMGAGHYVHYDLTSLGAGEKIFWKSTPPEKRISSEALNLIREQHADILRDLDGDSHYRDYRDTAQTLRYLRANRHTLAAVFEGDAAECDELLRRARLREYFGEQVYGLDSFQRMRPGLAQLYNQVIDKNRVDPDDAAIYRNYDNFAIIVDHTVEGVRTGRVLGTPALAYISKACPDSEIAERGERMVQAGAFYVATTMQDVITPFLGRADIYSKLPTYVTLPGAVEIKNSSPQPS